MTVYNILAVNQKSKDNTSKKITRENKTKQNKTKKWLKHVQPGSNHRQSIQHPNDRKQAPKEKAKTEDTNKEKQAKKKTIYILVDSMLKHLKG